jgi:peptide/nickel transport system substrate-binding protein
MTRQPSTPVSKRLVAALIATCTVLAACGGDDSTDSTTPASGGDSGDVAEAPDDTSDSAEDATPPADEVEDSSSDQSEQLADNQATGPATEVNAGEAADGGTITVALGADVQNWNVNSTSGTINTTGWIIYTMLPSVWKYLPDATFGLNEDLMVSAELVSEDPWTIRYEIREDAVWSDGTPITTADLLWMYESTMLCEECSGVGLGLDVVDTVTAETDKVAVVTLTKPFADWRLIFAQPIYPAHVALDYGTTAEAFNDLFSNNPPEVSGGPFMLKSFEPAVSISVERNPNWYGDGPHLDEIEFLLTSDPTAIPAALQNGDVDVATLTPQPNLVEQLAQMADAGIEFQAEAGPALQHIVFNLAKPVVSALPVRQAIATALDKDDIIARTVGQVVPGTPPSNSVLFLQSQPGYTDNATPLGFGEGDVDAATQLLEDAGYQIADGQLIQPDDATLPPIEFVHNAGDQLGADLAAVIARQVEPLGIQVVAVTTDDMGATLTESDGYSYDMVWFGATGLPALAYNAGGRYTLGRGYNQSFSNAEFDELVASAQASPDPDEVISLLNEADVILQREVYPVPLYQNPQILAYNNELVNIRNSHPFGGLTYNVAEWGFGE